MTAKRKPTKRKVLAAPPVVVPAPLWDAVCEVLHARHAFKRVVSQPMCDGSPTMAEANQRIWDAVTSLEIAFLIHDAEVSS